MLNVLAISAAAALTFAVPQNPEPPEMQLFIERLQADEGSLARYYSVGVSQSHAEQLSDLYTEYLRELEAMPFESMDRQARVDWLLLRNHLNNQVFDIKAERDNFEEALPLLPFADEVIALHAGLRSLEKPEPQESAALLNRLEEELAEHRKELADKEEKPQRTLVMRARGYAGDLQRTLSEWYEFHAGYHPEFTWWNKAPYEKFNEALTAYRAFLQTEIAGIKENDNDTIVGDPIGREELIRELESAYIVYTPEELLEIARSEFAWCDEQLLEASREMGYGDDWRAAQEAVKNMYVAPGEQPALIKDLAWEAIEFLEQRDLVTIPELAKRTWRMEMMSPERQRVSPFFLGGETILVSYPTAEMAHEDKLMSMRGNNPHFSRATVQHELIPGHHLQGFMTDRYRQYRNIFGTPFWTEGWALYWEMLLWDLGFPRGPEDKIGMLFWRMHRCARIIFSLSFHLGEWSPQECIDFLVERVGFERANAEAEVRRSFAGTYGPLYQLAYMIGGLQFRAMRREFVKEGEWTDREFHDAVLHSGMMPPAMVRALLSGVELSRDFEPGWRFYQGF